MTTQSMLATAPAPAGATVRPALVTTIAILTLVSGVFNVLIGVSTLVGGLFVAVIFGLVPQMANAYEFRQARFVGAMMMGIGIVTLVILLALAIYFLVLAFLELRYSVRLLANPPAVTRPARHIAVLEIVAVLGGNIIATLTGVLALAFYGEPAVQAYFAALSAERARAITA
ncbi:MAG: hypothetical protein RMN25_01100 [Anaerolineae bacterium]|nr:hypothetical protein [Thermoflexales bacterium]MDW8406352.1 hypothetical protein [Anaerolineae bacterium]